jgi:hypothetical protein
LRQVTSICHPDFHLRLSTPLSPSSVGPSPNSHLVAVQLRGSRLIKLSSYLMHLLILHFNPHPLRALYLRQPPNHKMQSSSPHFTVHTRHSHAPIASLHRPHSHAPMLPSHLRVGMPGTVHTRHSHAPIGDTSHAPMSSHPLVTHMLPSQLSHQKAPRDTIEEGGGEEVVEPGASTGSYREMTRAALSRNQKSLPRSMTMLRP